MPELAPVLFLLPYLLSLGLLAAVPASFEPLEPGRESPVFAVLRLV